MKGQSIREKTPSCGGQVEVGQTTPEWRRAGRRAGPGQARETCRWRYSPGPSTATILAIALVLTRSQHHPNTPPSKGFFKPPHFTPGHNIAANWRRLPPGPLTHRQQPSSQP